MSVHAPRKMTVAEFLEWNLRQEDRYELVNGVPQAMTGARVSHDRVVINVATALTNQLRATSSPCDVFGADIALIVPGGNVRRPDVAVYCPPFDERATALEQPSLIVKVLLESTQSVDQLFKLQEYFAIPGLSTIVFIAPTVREIGVWSRDKDAAWQRAVLRDAAAAIELPHLGISLPLSDIYERVVFQEIAGPRLAWPDPP